jgi:hypothetical protein
VGNHNLDGILNALERSTLITVCRVSMKTGTARTVRKILYDDGFHPYYLQKNITSMMYNSATLSNHEYQFKLPFCLRISLCLHTIIPTKQPTVTVRCRKINMRYYKSVSNRSFQKSTEQNTRKLLRHFIDRLLKELLITGNF